MSDAHGQPVVSVTQGWATGGPLPVPDRQPVARIPEQPDPVRVHRAGDEPPAAEMEQARLARRRPADRSARAVQNALDAVLADKATAAVHLANRKAAAGNAFDRGDTPAQVKAARGAVEVAQIELDQLGSMEAGLRTSLAWAQEAEAEEARALVASIPAAEAIVAEFRRFIETDYPKHAAKIAAGLALESQAEDAIRTLRAASRHVSGMSGPADLPLVQNGRTVEAYRLRASLPGTDVQPLMKWASAPSAVQF